MHAKSGLTDEVRRSTMTVAEAEEQRAGLHEASACPSRARRRCAATRSPPTGASSPATCRRSTTTCTTGWSTSRSIKELAGAGTRGSTSASRPRGWRTGRSPTSGRASASWGTTGRRSSCRSPGPDGDAAKAIAAAVAGRRVTPPRRNPLDAAARAGYDCPASRRWLRGVMVGVAQLVEHRVVVPGVAGSSPVAHPNFSYGGWLSPPCRGRCRRRRRSCRRPPR